MNTINSKFSKNHHKHWLCMAMDTPSIGIDNAGAGVNSGGGTGDVNSRFEKSLGLLTTR